LRHSKILAVALLLPLTNIQLLAQQTVGSSAELVAILRGHTKSILQIEFSHSGAIVAASSDGSVRLWRTDTGQSLMTIASDQGSEVFRMSWSSDDRRLAITYRTKHSWELAVWDVPSGQLPTISQRVQNIYLLEWSPNGHTFLALDQRLNVQVWDVIARQLTHTLTPALSTNEPFTVSFVADGQRILTASVDGPVQLWDVATGKLVATYPGNTFIPGWNYPSPHVSAVSLDKRFLMSGNLNIYETDTGRLVTSTTGGSSPISFSPDGKTILTVSYDAEKKLRHRQSYLSIRKIENGEELLAFQVPEGIREIIWSPDGKRMAIVGLTFNTRLIDAATGRENGRLPYGNCWPWTLIGSDGCEPIKFSADGEMLLKGKEPIKIWDAKTVSLIKVLKAARLPAVFSPTNGQLLATRSEDKKSVLLWRLQR
jgi:dipeptidyl aminopeptidase/acylaminoacyl peptidase